MALVGLSGAAQAQEAKPTTQKAGADTAKPTQLLAEFIAGFDLKQAPPLAVERARTAFIDTMGVTLAGSRSEPAALMLEMVKLEGATPTASIVGQSLRTSPQLAALANGVASHALDFDFTYTQGQLVAPVIPALLPLAEATGATPAETLAAFVVGFFGVPRMWRRMLRRSEGVGRGVGASVMIVEALIVGVRRPRRRRTGRARGWLGRWRRDLR